jgi:PAS domain-containing protein
VIGTRSRASLSQYLERQQLDRTELILNKYGIDTPEFEAGYGRPVLSLLGKIHQWLRDATSESIEQVLVEIVRTERSFYYARTSNAQVYQERYQDLTACLALDGYVVREGEFLQAEPNLDAAPLEDDLTRELQRSGLPDADDILQRLSSSAEDFRRTPPDLNGSLTNARVALQTLGNNISVQRAASRPAGFDETKWGQVVTHLRTAGVISTDEEKGIAGVFSFVSPGAHNILGVSETEMVRLGRSLVVTMCYFLTKRWNGRTR